MYDLLICPLQFEEAAKEVADEVTAPRPQGEEKVEDIQITLTSASNPVDVRNLQVRILIYPSSIFQFYSVINVIIKHKTLGQIF